MINYLSEFSNNIQNLEFMDIKKPYFYDSFDHENEDFKMSKNNYIIKNSNFEHHRTRWKKMKINNSDIIIFAKFIYVYAPFKRKLNRYVNQNSYKYNQFCNVFYLDNKLKIQDDISNRIVVFKKLEFISKAHNKKIILIEDSINYGISINSIIYAIKKITDGICPVTVFTEHPIINELAVFIFTNYINKVTDFSFIPKDCFEKSKIPRISFTYVNTNKNLLTIKGSNNYVFKTRKCILKYTDKNISCNNEINDPYLLDKENIIIIDNNYNDNVSPKIIINIPVNAMIFDHEKGKYFINKEHNIFDNISKTFKYFNDKIV